MLSSGKHSVRKLKRTQILPAAGAGVGDEAIANSTRRRRLDRLSDQAPRCARQLRGGSHNRKGLGHPTHPQRDIITVQRYYCF
jgi:hypothetical protein